MNNPQIELVRQVEIGKSLKVLETCPHFNLIINECYIENALLFSSRNLIGGSKSSRKFALDEIKAVNYLKKRLVEMKNISELETDELE